MRVAFMGTPDVAVPALRAVASSSHEVVVVVTQPDKPRGRGREVSASPVKRAAVQLGIPVLQPASPKLDPFADELATFSPDALAVVAYGHILPVAVLEVAPAMNVHFSLLPAYRGAAPVQRAVMDGVSETGVSVFMLEATIDTGPVVAVERVPVGPHDTSGDVFEALIPVGAALLVRCLDGLAAGTLTPQPQDGASASPAPKIGADEARIDWSWPAARIVNLVRAMNPRPGAHTELGTRRITVWRASASDGDAEPGVIVAPDLVGTGEGLLRLDEVQPAGKVRMSGADFARGYRPERFEMP